MNDLDDLIRQNETGGKMAREWVQTCDDTGLAFLAAKISAFAENCDCKWCQCFAALAALKLGELIEARDMGQ